MKKGFIWGRREARVKAALVLSSYYLLTIITQAEPVNLQRLL